MSIESVMPSNHLILCCSLLLLPSIFPSIRVFSNESPFRINWPKCWSFSISLSNESSGLISFRIDWFNLLAVQGFSRVFSNTTIQKHQFFRAQHSVLLHPYMTPGETVALTIWTFVGKVMSLLFNMLSRLGRAVDFTHSCSNYLLSYCYCVQGLVDGWVNECKKICSKKERKYAHRDWRSRRRVSSHSHGTLPGSWPPATRSWHAGYDVTHSRSSQN